MELLAVYNAQGDRLGANLLTIYDLCLALDIQIMYVIYLIA